MVQSFPVAVQNKMLSVFHGRDFVLIKGINNVSRVHNWQVTINKVARNIKNIPFNVTPELASIHLKETTRIVDSSNLRPNAKRSLIMHGNLKSNSKNKSILKLISMSHVASFFEAGVVPHPVYADYISETGNPVRNWMESHGFEADVPGFIVGGADSTQRKPGLQFFEKGFDKADKETKGITDKYILRI